MEALGVKRGDYVVRVNSRPLVDQWLFASGVPEALRMNAMRAVDKVDRLGIEGVLELFGEGRTDESGDFTPGLGLSEDQIAELQTSFIGQRILIDGETADGHSDEELLSWLEQEDAAEIPDAVQMRDLMRMVKAAGYDDRVHWSPHIMRGLEYYTGAVYECELTFPVTNERGETVTFGSVAGGGRYDGLVKRFTGQEVPATGFSIGVSRLMTALKNLGKLEGANVAAPVLVTVMDRDPEALAEYQKMVSELRAEGIRAEMYQGNPKQFGKQLQYADRRGSPVAIIQGSDEREKGVVQIKDLEAGKRLADEITSNEAWRASRPAQQEVARAELVAAVRKIVAGDDADDLEGGAARTTGADYPGGPDQRGEYE